jgi:LemA protein
MSLDEGAKKAWSDVDAQLQRRLELISNLVQTVKGYASHEKELFENIAKSREQYFQGQSKSQKIEASNQLSGLLSRLLVLQERYPDLKANQGFRDLQVSLEGTENRIAVARTRYNESARALNGYVRSLFGGFFCSKVGVEKADYFEASPDAKAAPQVQF